MINQMQTLRSQRTMRFLKQIRKIYLDEDFRNYSKGYLSYWKFKIILLESKKEYLFRRNLYRKEGTLLCSSKNSSHRPLKRKAIKPKKRRIWYGHIFVRRKTQKTLLSNPKGIDSSDLITSTELTEKYFFSFL